MTQIQAMTGEPPRRIENKVRDDGDRTNPKDIIGAKKPNLHLVPSALTIGVARAMEDGAAKYGPYNWRDKKVRATVYISAAQRHILEFLDGENNAGDSGVEHLAHAAACCGILLDAAATGCLIDDRPIKGAASDLIAKHTKGKNYGIEPLTHSFSPP